MKINISVYRNQCWQPTHTNTAHDFILETVHQQFNMQNTVLYYIALSRLKRMYVKYNTLDTHFELR